jgi:acyl-CoA synthetase (AMP-forming)/AMP-acid ligase II
MWSLVEKRAAASPDALMLLDDRGRSLTYEQYRTAAVRTAAGLAEQGVGPGTPVSWQLPTVLEAAVLLAALSRLGAVQNPLVPILRRREVGFIVSQTGADLLIVPGVWRSFDYEAMARDVAADTGCRVLVTGHPDTMPGGLPGGTDGGTAGGALALPTGDADAPLPLPPDEDAGARAVRWVFYSSGTTGDPKGACHTDRSIMAGANGMVARVGLGADDRYPVVFPIAHIGGANVLSLALETACPLILVETFDMQRTPLSLARLGPTYLGSTVPFFHAYLDAQRRSGPRRLYPKLKALLGGGAPKPPELHAEVKAVLDCAGIISSWGLTEFPMATYCSADDTDDQLANTEGRLSPGVEMRTVGDDGSDCPPGTEGELRLRGPQLFLGYLDSSLNDDAFDADGFFRTGDLGVIGPEGHVRITGRSKDVIIRNAENISAREVEEVLLTHPLVRDVAVIGLPDARTGERCCAVVELTDPPATLGLPDLAEHCRAAGLTTQKIPEQLEVVDALPRNAMGKIAKQELRARFR